MKHPARSVEKEEMRIALPKNLVDLAGFRITFAQKPLNSPDMTDWQFASNLTNTAGTAEFIDELVTKHPQRFFRARSSQ